MRVRHVLNPEYLWTRQTSSTLLCNLLYVASQQLSPQKLCGIRRFRLPIRAKLGQAAQNKIEGNHDPAGSLYSPTLINVIG